MVKLTKRKGFNFFRSYYDVYNELNDKDKVLFMDALLDRQFLGVKPNELEGMSKFAYISQTNSIDSQVKGYEDKTGTRLNDPTAPPPEPPSDGGKNPPTLQVQVEGKEKVKVKEKEERVFSSEIHDCLNACIKHFPEHLQPNTPKKIQTALETIKKLNEIDSLPFELIESIVERTRKDGFWSKNFLSINKLRKKNNDGILYVVVFNEQTKNLKNGTFAKKSRSEQIKEHNLETARKLGLDK